MFYDFSLIPNGLVNIHLDPIYTDKYIYLKYVVMAELSKLTFLED